MDAVTDEKLRWSILQGARLIPGDQGFVAATLLVDRASDDKGARVADDAHAIRLLNELVEWNLLEEERSQHLAGAGRSLRHRRFRLTTKGFGLWMGDLQPVAGVWDRRLEA